MVSSERLFSGPFEILTLSILRKTFEKHVSQSTGEIAEELIDTYNMSIKDIVNKHAPKQVKIITLRPHAPWYNDHIREAKREKRRRERKYKKYIIRCKQKTIPV